MKLDRLETEQQLAVKRREFKEAKSGFPLDTKKIISLKQDVAAYEAGIKAIDELTEELGLREEDLASK